MRDAQTVRRGDELAGVPEGDARRERGEIDEEQRGDDDGGRAQRTQSEAPAVGCGTIAGGRPASISRTSDDDTFTQS